MRSGRTRRCTPSTTTSRGVRSQAKRSFAYLAELRSAQYRHVILEPIEDSLEASVRAVCDEYGYEILSLHISPDHVHLFLSAHPKHAPTEIVRTVKSITAREMWEQHESYFEEYL